MAIHIKHINGHDYAYDVKSVWDKEKKKVRKVTTYLGAITNREINEYKRVRSQKIPKEKAILNYGYTYLLNESLKNSEFSKNLETVLPAEQDTLKSLIYYKMLEGSSFNHALNWFEGNIASMLFPNAKMDSKRISEFLARLGNETTQRALFKKYLTLNSRILTTILALHAGFKVFLW